MQRRTERQRRLASLTLFAGCTTEELAAIERLACEVIVPAARTLFCEGITSPQFLIVLDGSIDLTRAGECVGKLSSGEWFGHASLLAHGATESISAVTSTRTRVLAFSRREFASLLHVVPAVRARLARLEPVDPSVNGRGEDVDPETPRRADWAFPDLHRGVRRGAV